MLWGSPLLTLDVQVIPDESRMMLAHPSGSTLLSQCVVHR